jgi:hypothetical protein
VSEGAQATVIRGHWLDREVAIKKAIIREAVDLVRFRREVDMVRPRHDTKRSRPHPDSLTH